MSTAKWARNVLIIVTAIGGGSMAAPAFADTLDLAKLSESVYTGGDKHRKKPCVLDVGPAERDFVNRRTQTFRVATETTDFKMSMVLKGGNNTRVADFALGNDKVQFNITIDDKRLELVADKADTLNISLVRVFGQSSSGEGLMLECQNIVRSAR